MSWCGCRDWDQAYKELEMQRGYCAVSTKYSPALIQRQALASPDAFLKVGKLPNLHPHKRTQAPLRPGVSRLAYQQICIKANGAALRAQGLQPCNGIVPGHRVLLAGERLTCGGAGAGGCQGGGDGGAAGIVLWRPGPRQGVWDGGDEGARALQGSPAQVRAAASACEVPAVNQALRLLLQRMRGRQNSLTPKHPPASKAFRNSMLVLSFQPRQADGYLRGRSGAASYPCGRACGRP